MILATLVYELQDEEVGPAANVLAVEAAKLAADVGRCRLVEFSIADNDREERSFG